MAGKCLLDTNIVIALFANEAGVIAQLQETDEIFVPSTVIGELYYGARKSGRPEANQARIDGFAASNTILSCDVETAYWYGVVKDELRRKGRPIPENDVWIAAIACQYDLTVVTRDEHFDQVETLKVEAW